MHGGSGTGLAQDATIQAMIGAMGGSPPQGGDGVGAAQDASLQALYTLLSGGGAAALTAILKNRAQNLVTTNQLGIVGGGNLVPPVTLTMVASGKLRVTVNSSFQTNGTVNPVISAIVNGGAPTVLWTFQSVVGNNTEAANAIISAVFELDSAALAGQTVQVFFTSSVGDHSLSEFPGGTGDACANILLEELP